MISIIVCSINLEYIQNLKDSIKRTVLLPFEIIVIDNCVEKLSLSKAYNKGVSYAKYDNLIFVHEDVEFLNVGWCEKLTEILIQSEIGIVGIAGSNYLPSVPTGWYMLNEIYNNVFIHQGFKYTSQKVRLDNQGEDLTQVYLLDGVFLAMRKDVWLEFPFNESLTGFHAYDVDICQRVSSKYKNIFTKQIELLHKSEGKIDKTYFDAILEYKDVYFNYRYPKRDFKIELALLKQFFLNLRCYYDKDECISKIKRYHSIRILGFKGYFQFKKILNNAK